MRGTVWKWSKILPDHRSVCKQRPGKAVLTFKKAFRYRYANFFSNEFLFEVLAKMSCFVR